MIEQELFNYLKECCYPDLEKSKRSMSRWDCFSEKENHRIELKCRKKHYDDLMIEKSKYDAMIRICNKHLNVPMYICSTPRGVFRYNLFDIEPVWIDGLYPLSTEFSNKFNVSKTIANINIKYSDQI